jgi:hexosaminidase
MLNTKISIIPEPVKIASYEGKFEISEDTIISSDSKSKEVARYFTKLLNPVTGLKLKIKDDIENKRENNVINLKVIQSEKYSQPEAYTLEISQSNIIISALAPSGIFYGIQTLRQLLPPEIENKERKELNLSVPCLTIEDSPRFSWRGFMLDESRHFFGKEIAKRILDLMALLKLNVFHWHLTDDQGWRIEIKKYPLLTEIGSKRKGTILGSKRKELDGIPVSGYYSQNDLKEIINFAKERFITIIPEIDIPGHTTAVLASYPDLSCTGGPFEVSMRFGVHKEILCVGKEKVFDFVKDVMKEVLEIFPSTVIHIGGDEVPTIRWKKCSDCQALITKEEISSIDALQVYFTNRIVNFLSSCGRRAMGWNEILNENLIKDAICQYWTNKLNVVLKHIRENQNVVMSERKAVYLNYPYNITPLQKTYKYDPIPSELEEEFHNMILGIEGCLWSEYVPEIRRLEWQIFPRLCAIAETGWTSRINKNFYGFLERLNPFLRRLKVLGINYALKEDIGIENDFINEIRTT